MELLKNGLCGLVLAVSTVAGAVFALALHLALCLLLAAAEVLTAAFVPLIGWIRAKG